MSETRLRRRPRQNLTPEQLEWNVNMLHELGWQSGKTQQGGVQEDGSTTDTPPPQQRTETPPRGGRPRIGSNRGQLSPEQDLFSEDRLRTANRDISEAQQFDDPDGHFAQDRQALMAALAEVARLREGGQVEAAAEAVVAARRIALGILARRRQFQEQREVWDRMSGPLERVRKTDFTPVANQGVRQEKLAPGPNFNAYLVALTAFEHDRTPQTAATLEQAARDYLQHFANDLNAFQKKTKDNRRKRQICEAALQQARHMRMALQMEQIGPPPWDERTAMQAAEIRAAFSFESMGEKAPPLLRGSGGASATFWVKGWNEQSEVDEGKKDFLFKPVKGEDMDPPFRRGDSTPREAITKALTDKVGAMTGIDFGVPPTSVVSIAPENIDLQTYNKAQEGQAGNNVMLLDPTVPQTGSLQQFVSSLGEVRDQPDGFLETVPQSECEKAAVLDILCLNGDRHPGNFMVGAPQQGEVGPRLIPIDHGLALPGRNQVKRIQQRMMSIEGNVLLKMPKSFEPFSNDMRDRIALMDPDALKQGIQDSIGIIDDLHPELNVRDHIGEESAELARRSAMFLKLACGRLSPAVVQIALASSCEELFDASAQEFPDRAEAVIALFEGHAEALTATYLEYGGTLPVQLRLKDLGWHAWGDYVWASEKFNPWFGKNATLLVAAYKNETAWAGQIDKPPR